MQRLILDQDIKSMSEFRANTAACIHQVQSSKRPVVITQHGKSAAVLIDVAEFEAMSQRLELLEDIAMGESMIDEGKGIPHDKAKELILKRIAG
ncbi:type II toxin-antitoxin system Phd/YefM family antitoxin [Pontiellaceae bacterium B1224]|nr:type II toxin-antitoxin system Phd/YefM family antitoxin [Pontiellaceae bacterium B1224]